MPRPIKVFAHLTALSKPEMVSQRQWDEALLAFQDDPSLLEEAIQGDAKLHPEWHTPEGKRAAALIVELEVNNQLYYVHNTSLISDHEWDKLYHELKAIEAANPNLVSRLSPTQRVGALMSSTLKAFKPEGWQPGK